MSRKHEPGGGQNFNAFTTGATRLSLKHSNCSHW